jgi:hypothetical protein
MNSGVGEFGCQDTPVRGMARNIGIGERTPLSAGDIAAQDASAFNTWAAETCALLGIGVAGEVP